MTQGAGYFITLEAVDGAGKTTQAQMLAKALRAEGHEVVLTREPGGSPMAEEIRNLLLTGDPDKLSTETELLLFMAARRDHIEHTIRPALMRGAIVICDRYLGSSMALQGAKGLDQGKIVRLFEDWCGLYPDMTLLLDIDPEIALARAMDRLGLEGGAEDRFERMGLAYHRKVRENFIRLYVCDARWRWLNAEQSAEALHADIMNVVGQVSRCRAPISPSGQSANRLASPEH